MDKRMAVIVDRALTVMADPRSDQVFLPALRKELLANKRMEGAVAKAVVAVATTHTSLYARYKAYETLSEMTEEKANLLNSKMLAAVAHSAAHDQDSIARAAQWVLGTHLRNGGRQEKLLLALAKGEVTNSDPKARAFAHRMSWGVAYYTGNNKLKRKAVDVLLQGTKDRDPEVSTRAQKMLVDLDSTGRIRRQGRIVRRGGFAAQY